MSRSEPRMTTQTTEVLAALLTRPDTPLYGLQIAQATELPVGTVYPVLQRLTAVGWLVASMEDPSIAESEGRPRRRYYKFTNEGQTRAYNAIKTAEQRRARTLRVLGVEGG